MTAARVVRQPGRIHRDPSRVITRQFVPGHHRPVDGEGLATGVVAHILALDDEAVAAALADVMTRFAGRHRDLTSTFRHHADRIGNRLPPDVRLSDSRWLLLGATFTNEIPVEAAAVCNPSAVVLPDQTGVPAGSVRMVMSVRQITEGHRSSIGFRSGLVDAAGDVALDPPAAFTTAARISTRALDAQTFRDLASSHGEEGEAVSWVLGQLASRFTLEQLEAQLTLLEGQGDTRRHVAGTVERFRKVAARSYTATFPGETELGERVLYPTTAVEVNGMEDVRFVRFTEDDGAVTYFGTYTAFDGRSICQQVLVTTDFLTFDVLPLHGAAATNKGLALFPRRIGGRYAALSRPDGAGNAVALSDDLQEWSDATMLNHKPAAWEAVQVGNCGPPIETPEGWLVLTHGVGPMRTYSIGALLLDRDDPTVVIGRLTEPLLSPSADEQDGYVPNVLYSCGSLAHEGTLVIPYGIGDMSIGFATAAVAEVVGAMTPVSAAPAAVGCP